MAIDKITIINRALSSVGAGRIGNLTDEANLPTIEVYDTVVEDVLSRYPWTFSTPVRQLAQLSAAPADRWKYAYQLPSDRLGALRAVYSSKDWRCPFTCFEIREEQLLSDATEIWARYTRASEPIDWPGYFRKLIVEACGAEYALTVREDQALWARMRAMVYGTDEVSGKIGDAMALDAMGKPSPQMQLDDGPLIRARDIEGSTFAPWQDG